LRYRRSFAFANSIDDFANVKLEIMALYFCADIFDEISKPIQKYPDRPIALQAGLKAVVKGARKRLIDGDETLRIFNDAFVSKHAEIKALKEPSTPGEEDDIEIDDTVDGDDDDNDDSTPLFTDAEASKRAAMKAKADRAEATSAAAKAKLDPDRKPKFDEFQRVDGQIKTACDYNGEDPGDVEEPGDTREMMRHRIFVHHANEATRHAREHGFDKAADSEITDEIVELAKTAAKEWTNQAAALARRATDRRQCV
jgi:hypothetical protein